MRESSLPSSSARRRNIRSQARNFSVIAALETVIAVGVIVATLLTFWTPSNLFSDQMLNQMLAAIQSDQPSQPEQPLGAGPYPTTTPGALPRIGIVSGHWGNDSGAVCSDGLTEEKVNLRIATLVQQYLMAEGYQVELLKEKDNKLDGYQAMVLVSIHNNSCDYVNSEATGFKVAAAKSTKFPEKAARLTACLSDRYENTTGLTFHFNTVTIDMTEYHAFNEIDPNTTAAIIETGFMNLDRDILTKHPDTIAKGVSSGILCFVRNEPVNQQEPSNP